MGVMELLQKKKLEEEEEEESSETSSVVLQELGEEEQPLLDVDEPGESFKEVCSRMLTPRFVVTVVQHQGGSCWRRRCPRARKSFMHGPFGVGAGYEVGAKRKLDEAVESESEESESEESEQWKRRRGGEDEEDEEDHGEPELREMQHLLELQLQAAEKREAGMKQRMETMMEVLSQHMGHMERCVRNLETVEPQVVLERINLKLEQVMEGFSTLNENLAILSACLSKDLDKSP